MVEKHPFQIMYNSPNQHDYNNPMIKQKKAVMFTALDVSAVDMTNRCIMFSVLIIFLSCFPLPCCHFDGGLPAK